MRKWDTLREWTDVSAEARAKGERIHLGFLFGLMVEKGSEFPEGDERRYSKYRIVFRGNDVKDQNWERCDVSGNGYYTYYIGNFYVKRFPLVSSWEFS